MPSPGSFRDPGFIPSSSSLGLASAFEQEGERFGDIRHFTVGYRRYLLVPDEQLPQGDDDDGDVAGGTEAATGPVADHGEQQRLQLSLFVEAGFGWYDPERGPSETGIDFKLGMEVPISQRWGLEAVVAYHDVDASDRDLEFVNLLVGLRYHVLERTGN